MDDHLLPHELTAVALMLAFIAFLTALSLSGQATGDLVSLTKESREAGLIEVRVGGAVEHPGLFKMQTGAKYEDLLALAGTTDHADLRKIKKNRKLKHGRSYQVKARPQTTIYLEGAVKTPGPYQVYADLKLNELVDKNWYSDDADLTVIQKKRRVKAGEVIRIPQKRAS
ncbi:MAG: SLBB domain-containing protein [Chlamydiales bacterium]|nr:SLBB domain-containing protein [Chlamydiia bacterium]MCP5506904.1 SLBB domain-containing protein [Chlamydiales bacterium]